MEMRAFAPQEDITPAELGSILQSANLSMSAQLVDALPAEAQRHFAPAVPDDHGQLVIWKFTVGFRGWHAIELPANARIVLVGLDPATGGPAIWAMLDPDAPKITRRFGIFPTGGTIAADADHVGSLIDRTFVWHIFEQRG